MDSCARGAYLPAGGLVVSLAWLQAARVSNSAVVTKRIKVDRVGAYGVSCASAALGSEAKEIDFGPHVSCSGMATRSPQWARISRRLKILPDYRIKGEPCDELPFPSK